MSGGGHVPIVPPNSEPLRFSRWRLSDAGRRKKERARRAIADAALRQFSANGFDATTVAAICEEADVAVSTFYVYFESKEAAAFPDADARAEAAERILAERPAGEAVHTTLRRAAHAIVEQDRRAPDAVASRSELLAREPRLAAYAGRPRRSTSTGSPASSRAGGAQIPARICGHAWPWPPCSGRSTRPGRSGGRTAPPISTRSSTRRTTCSTADSPVSDRVPLNFSADQGMNAE